MNDKLSTEITEQAVTETEMSDQDWDEYAETFHRNQDRFKLMIEQGVEVALEQLPPTREDITNLFGLFETEMESIKAEIQEIREANLRRVPEHMMEAVSEDDFLYDQRAEDLKATLEKMPEVLSELKEWFGKHQSNLQPW